MNSTHIASTREEALSIMKWLYVFAFCVALVASENPDGKFHYSFVLLLSVEGISCSGKPNKMLRRVFAMN